jgi:hypothetical protein
MGVACGEGKSKGKVYLITGHEGPKVEKKI